MMTTLFSVSFTSCIDNEVSPVVEAIYEAQADLIAAQAGVQNAEAALLLAQANAENAYAEWQSANTAQVEANTAGIIANNAYLAAQREQYLRAQIAQTDLAVEQAENALGVAQAQFELTMANLVAQMEAAGANLAVGYAYDYMYAMNVVNNLKSQKVTAEGQLALAELYLKAGTPETTWELYLEGLNDNLAVQEGKITAAEAAIAEYEEAMANPTARETQIADLKGDVADLEERQIELVALKALALQDVNDAQAAITAATTFMSSPTGTYATAKANLTLWKGYYATDTANVRIETANVALHTAAITNYAGTTTTLTTAKNAAIAVIGQSATLPYSGLKGDIKTIENTLGTDFGTPVWSDAPKTGAAALTEYGKLWNAELALALYQHDFDLLTATYNAAADALADAQAAFDGTTYAADLAAANLALSTYQAGGFAAAQLLYSTTFTAWNANKNGTVWTDTAVDAWDLGKVGIHTDDNTLDSPFGVATGVNTTKTYYRVATWSEPLPGSWVPATTTGVGMNAAALASYKVAFEVANGANTAIFADDDVSAAISLADKNNALLAETANGLRVYFIEVETDDAHNDPILDNGNGGNLDTFNNATNALGTEVTTAFYTGTTTRDYSPVAYAGLTVNGITYNASGYITAPVTAYTNLWNLQKAASEAAWDLSIGDDALIAAQEEFDYQQELFEDGLAVIATLEAAVDARLAVIGNVYIAGPPVVAASGLLGQWEALTTQLGASYGTPIFGDVAKTTSTVGAWYYVGAVKTLTAYAVKWNAELALVNHLNTTLSAHQTMLATAQANLTTATREAAEDLIYIAKYTADLAALQAEYDALILTPLYAELNVTKIEAQQVYDALVAEDSAATTMIASLNLVISALQTTVPDYAALITIEEGKITAAEANILATEIAIAKGEVSVADLERAVQLLKDQIATFTIRIANAQAIADKFKALMDAALAS